MSGTDRKPESGEVGSSGHYRRGRGASATKRRQLEDVKAVLAPSRVLGHGSRSLSLSARVASESGAKGLAVVDQAP